MQQAQDKFGLGSFTVTGLNDKIMLTVLGDPNTSIKSEEDETSRAHLFESNTLENKQSSNNYDLQSSPCSSHPSP